MAAPSALDYARYHGLAVDLRSEASAIEIIRNNSSLRDVKLELPDPSVLDLNECLCKDKLQVTISAARLLSDCAKSPLSSDVDVFSLVSEPPKRHLRVETPMLESDHAQDMKWFRKPIDPWNLIPGIVASVNAHSVKNQITDILADCENASASLQEVTLKERVQVSVRSLEKLKLCATDPLTKKDMEDALQSGFKMAKGHAEHLSPLPSPHIYPQHWKLDSPDLPLLDSVRKHAVDIAANCLDSPREKTSKMPETFAMGDPRADSASHARSVPQAASTIPNSGIIYHEANDFTLDPMSHPRKISGIPDLQWDEPMAVSLPESGQKPKEGSESSFEEVFDQFIDFPISLTIRTGPLIRDESKDDEYAWFVSSESFDGSLNTDIANPKLNALDQCLHLELPQVVGDFDTGQRQEAPAGISEIISAAGIKCTTFPVEHEMRLNWIPIPPNLMCLDLHETIESSALADKLLSRPEGILQSDQFLYHRPGLRLLDVEDESDDELEEDAELVASLGAKTDSTIPQKRSAEDAHVEDSGCLQSISHKATTPFCGSEPETVPKSRETMDLLKRVPEDSQSEHRKAEALFQPAKKIQRRWHKANAVSGSSATVLSPGHLLDAFLELKGKRFKQLGTKDPRDLDKADRFDASEVDPILATQPSNLERCRQAGSWTRSGSFRNPHKRIEVPSTPIEVYRSPPMPTIDQLEVVHSVIVDSAIVNRRQLHTFLERQEHLHMIYRDLRGSPDIILNPKSCVVYTNFQALTQKLLPGQEAKGSQQSVHDKISWLASTYESIFVLVSISASLWQTNLDVQIKVKTDFSGFCAGFKMGSDGVEVRPVWIVVDQGVDAGEVMKDSLCCFTWSMIFQHALRNDCMLGNSELGQPLVFIQDETVWELFLCKAGMNVMAAQLVLGYLKRADIDGRQRHDTKEASWGLAKFVELSKEQRIEIFEGVVGRRAIDRLSCVVDHQATSENI